MYQFGMYVWYVPARAYPHTCEYARAYASQGDPDAFANPTGMARTASLSGNYVDGVSITYGTPPTHIWTYAAGASVSSNSKYGCPCNTEPGVQPPTFVGTDYYCETGTTQSGSWCTNDPLWDGM